MRFKCGKKKCGVDHGGLHSSVLFLAHALDHSAAWSNDNARFVAENSSPFSETVSETTSMRCSLSCASVRFAEERYRVRLTLFVSLFIWFIKL
jgi:hypothetical protein